jgi:hypothetical protein
LLREQVAELFARRQDRSRRHRKLLDPDYGGTLAYDGRVRESTIRALERRDPSLQPFASGPSIRSTCVAGPIWPHTRALKPLRSSRKFSITAGSLPAITSASEEYQSGPETTSELLADSISNNGSISHG